MLCDIVDSLKIYTVVFWKSWNRLVNSLLNSHIRVIPFLSPFSFEKARWSYQYRASVAAKLAMTSTISLVRSADIELIACEENLTFSRCRKSHVPTINQNVPILMLLEQYSHLLHPCVYFTFHNNPLLCTNWRFCMFIPQFFADNFSYALVTFL